MIMKRIFLGLLWVALTQISILGKAQSVETQLQDYADNPIVEQVSIQVSETIVGAGETIWFQASINPTDTTQEPSRVIYLELFNQQKLAVVQGIYQASLGLSTGQLTLPDSLAGGWYQLRAYTQYMLNGRSNRFFTQPILVVNTNATKPASAPDAQRNQANFALHPEGGNWVAGEENKIIAQFHSLENYSDTAQLAILQVADSAVVARTAVLHRLEELTFTPKADTSYLARFINTDTSYIQLPQAQPDNFALQVNTKGASLEINVTKPSAAPRAFIAIRSGKRLLHFQPVDQPSFTISLPVSQTQGLVEIAILDNQATVFAQRLFYTEGLTNNSLISLSESTVSPREELQVSLNNSPNLNEATLALTVRKIRFSRYPLSVAALDNVGLSGVSLPADLPAEQAPTWINQWLVTQNSAWPRWSEMLAQKNSSQKYELEDEMLLITGSVQTSQPINEDDQVLLSIPGDDPYFEYSEIEEDGRFAIPISRVYGLQNSILQYNSATDELPQDIRWKIDNIFASSSPSNFSHPYTISDKEWQQLVDDYQARKSIQQGYYDFEEDAEDTVAKTRKQFRFYGAPNMQIDPEDYIDLPSFEEICRELLPGVRLMKKKKVYDFDIFNPASRKFLPNEPILLLDGVPIQDKEYIINYPPDQIDFIETVNRRTYYGNVRLDGVLAIYTKQEKAYEDALSGKAHFTTLPYYTPSAPFSSPDSLTKSLPDFRTLLYWKPNITLHSDNTPSFSFTTSDELGQYEVVVQGLTKKGESFYESTIFEVQPANLP